MDEEEVFNFEECEYRMPSILPAVAATGVRGAAPRLVPQLLTLPPMLTLAVSR